MTRRYRKTPLDMPGKGAGKKGRGGFVPSGPWAGGASSAPEPAPSQDISIAPPWEVRPAMAREINVDASGTGFVSGTTLIPGSPFTVPAQNLGIIRSVVLSLNNMLTTSAISWTLRSNGSAIEGWNQITIFPRNAGSVSVAYGPDETYIYLEEGVTVDAQVTVGAADPNAYQAGVTLHGWTYPKRLAQLFGNLYSF